MRTNPISELSDIRGQFLGCNSIHKDPKVPDGPDASSSVTKMAFQPPGGSAEPPPLVPEPSYFPSSDEKTVISKRPLAVPALPPSTVRPVEVGRSLVGESLGHFHLEEFVGGGGMGAVFRAVDTTLGRTVAVKVVSNQSADEDMLRRFRNEAQSAARLDHPNIARVYYVGEEKGWSYIVFEFIEGVNIRDLVVQNGPLPIEDVISYTLQIADALEHASERDVVHRDIKPSNILVMPDGRAKVVDMGLARLHQVDSPSQDLTETGVTLGTFDYISPEQARDPRSADVRSDLYSLGCTLYFMLTGMPPFPEGTVLQKLLSHSSDPPPDPREIRADLDDELCAITLRLMAKLPSQRYQSPGELVHRLLMLSDRLGIPQERRFAVSLPPPVPNWQSLTRRHLPWIIPAVFLVTTVVVMERMRPAQRVVTHKLLQPFPEAGDTSAAANAGSSQREGGQGSAESPSPEATSGATNPSVTQTTPGESTARTGNGAATTDSSAAVPGSSTPAGKAGESPHESPSSTANSSPAVNRTDIADTNTSPEESTAGGKTATAESTGQGNAAQGSPRPNGSGTSSPINTALMIVSPDASATDNPQVFNSLDSAFLKLASSPQVETIELRFRQRIESPLTLAPRSKEGELTIRAATDFNPLIIFRPSSSESRDRNLFKVIGGKVNFVGIHFRVELSSQVSDDWSLFHLKDTGRVTFKDCTLTIRNDRGGTASFFSIDAPSRAKTMMMPTETPDVQSGPLIELKSCVVRGDANVVRAMNGLPFRLNWNQGFLATSHTAMVARGLRDTNGTRLISLNFSNVTGSLGSGLCLIDLDTSTPVVPDLRVETTNCIWYQLDSEAPLVEHRGVENTDSLAQNLFRYAGENNRYPKTNTIWRIQTKTGETINYRWRDPSPAAGMMMWYTEASIDKGVNWKRALPGEGRATYAYSFHDFALESELATMAGFNEIVLPEPREPDPETPPMSKPASPRSQFDLPL